MTARRKPATEHDCARDAIGRRTAVGKTGSAFAQTDTVNYGYNDRSEVMSGVAVNDATYNYGYSYDPIGNRLQSSLGQQTCDYTSNQLNQYTAVSCLPPAPAYDDDGNMREMPSTTGSWTLTWDTENRLISAESATARLEFQYDYMSRRVEKRTYSGTPGNWTMDQTILFLYDGWNLVCEFATTHDPQPTTHVRSYTWGLDLSQALQGAGGVGGLLASTIHDPQPTTYVATYDANGNVSEYLDASAATAAHYEYDPCGGLTVATGLRTDGFAHRFSTKSFDTPMGLCYYGRRYYSPSYGRWASRDSLEERGGIHLYALTANSPLQRYDALGEAVVVPVVPVLIVVGGSLAIEVAVRVVCVCRFQRCQEAYVRTPVSILIHFSGVFNAVGQTACNGPYTVRTKLWKDVRGDCHSAYVVLCLSVVSPGGGGLAGPGITGAGF